MDTREQREARGAGAAANSGWRQQEDCGATGEHGGGRSGAPDNQRIRQVLGWGRFPGNEGRRAARE